MTTTSFDFKKPLESAQALMGLQTTAVTKTVELQKKAAEELTEFFKAEAEKAKNLKTPQEFVKFNIESNKALFELMKAQGEAFTALAKESSEETIAEITKLAS
ncbi:hypothetical protein Q4508_14925 [Amphritea sp. 2_MG-2023]|uniref:hypothetical protein n=1 Tax=Amphritea TaxID=515417 RepID=UPI001C065F13|nr:MULTISPECIES: hypothetical protein [Amphritea]MBU2966413.1 hypothetical protein [Amphritea atlantica]MDO6419851.1 hypothetical protein [Amphritea sp. 2_MG-2023]MDX2422064.1 hypothetical protein [Amphritea sp.]